MNPLTRDEKIAVLWDLNNISPRWVKHLSLHDGTTDIDRPEEGLDITNNATCIVGEPYGFTNEYSTYKINACSACHCFSMNVVSITTAYANCGQYDIHCNERAWHSLKEFVAHIKKVHPDLLLIPADLKKMPESLPVIVKRLQK